MKNEDKTRRTLSEAEQRRKERFDKISEGMEKQGYTRRDLTTGMGKANGFAIFLMILLYVIGYGIYYLVHHTLDYSGINLLVFAVVLVVLFVVHELIHGICWSFFAPHHFKDIEFGIMRSSMTPYCTCLVPLQKSHDIFGSVMPFIILGIIPMIAGIAFRNSSVLLAGIIMAAGAAGDIMIIRNIIGYKSGADEIIYMDHPTEAGFVVFER